MKFVLPFLARLAVPIGILAAGGYGYSVLSVEPPAEETEPVEEQVIRSRVKTLHAGDYPVLIETNAVVTPHNPVTLSAEVTGIVRSTETAFEIGSFFSRGDLLVEIDDRDYRTALKIARQEHELAEATLKLAETAHQRMTELARRNSASISELDETFAALVQARSQVAITESAIEQADRDLRRTKIHAPFDGRVATKMIGVGQLVSPGTLLGDIFAVDYAEVRLPIAQGERRYLNLPEMEGDRPVEVELRDAIDPTAESVWRAKIVRTEGALDADSLELFAIARIDDPFALNSDHCVLRIGQPVKATIRGETLRDVVAIPRVAVRRLDKVYLIDGEDQTLRSLTIEPLWSDSENMIVNSRAIRDGELLATTTLVYAPEGSRVEIIPDINSDHALAGEPPPMDATP